MTDQPAPTDAPLERDLEMLRLAGAFYRHEGERLNEARRRFDVSGTQLYRTCNRLLDDPRAAVAEPLLVARLRRLRDVRSRQRTARRAG